MASVSAGNAVDDPKRDKAACHHSKNLQKEEKILRNKKYACQRKSQNL